MDSHVGRRTKNQTPKRILEPSLEEKGICVVCRGDGALAHKCKECRQPCHIPCAIPPEIGQEEGYGSQVICKKCGDNDVSASIKAPIKTSLPISLGIGGLSSNSDVANEDIEEEVTDNDDDWVPEKGQSSSEEMSDDLDDSKSSSKKKKKKANSNNSSSTNDSINESEKDELITKSLQEEKENDDKEEKSKDEDEGDDRKNWTQVETRELIRVIERSHILDLFDHTGIGRKKVFEKVSRALKKVKVQRSASQCSAKWRRLKKSYNIAVAQLKKSGSGIKPKQKFKWFDEIHKFLATRPCSALKGVESVKFDEGKRKNDSDLDSEDDESKADHQSTSSSGLDNQIKDDSKTRKKSSKKHISKKTRPEMLKDVMDDTNEKWEEADIRNFERMKEYTNERDEKMFKRLETMQKNLNEQFLRGIKDIWESKPAPYQPSTSNSSMQAFNQLQQPAIPPQAVPSGSRPLSNVTNYPPFYPHSYYPNY